MSYSVKIELLLSAKGAKVADLVVSKSAVTASKEIIRHLPSSRFNHKQISMYILCDIWLETVLQPDKLWIFYSNGSAAVPSIYNIGTDK